MERELTKAERVRILVLSSLFQKDEVIDYAPPKERVVETHGIKSSFGFNKDRLEANREKIIELLKEIVTEPFLKGHGDGYSFLEFCRDRNGEIWGDHRIMDELLCLSIGLGVGGFNLPREMWAIMPASMPYIWFDLK